MPQTSKIFSGYRALGFVSNHIPLEVRYIRRRRENLIITCVGNCFHTYGSNKLGLLSISTPQENEITCITADAFMVFTACGKVIQAWRRGSELKHTYEGHQKSVHLMMTFGPHLISVDEESTLKMWDIKSEELYLEMNFSDKTFSITTMMHPSTYLNKILLGSRQGIMQLWNVKTTKLIYTFNAWDSPITVLEQAPAIHVVAVGLANGHIYLHNLLYDKTVLHFQQDWGPVTSVTFRTDGPPIMVSGSSEGHIAVWNLEERKLTGQMRFAHQAAVTGMKCLPNEPLLVTSSPDNTLKMWIFDMPDDRGRLLRRREGHAAPPSRIRFHGRTGDNVLSAGQDSSLRIFSTRNDDFNKSLGRASFNRKASKNKKATQDPLIMPPIMEFASAEIREKEWDNIAACHRGSGLVTTWNYDQLKMGEKKLRHERFKKDVSLRKVVATSVCLTACGNFVLIGYDSGHLDKFNIQSGIHRGSYGTPLAHKKTVRGLVSDVLNQVVISGGADALLHFWAFKKANLLGTTTLEASVSLMMLHRESNMLAIASEDFSIHLVDVDTRRIVRQFMGHSNRIMDIAFSVDSRWLITSAMDSTVRVWDIPSGHLVDFIMVDPPCTSLTMSPNGEFLATTHVGDLGIYLWSNRTLYAHVQLQPLPPDYEPAVVALPDTAVERSEETADEMDVEVKEEDEFKSPEQIADELVTLSLLPNSRWQNLLNIDIIKRRNKPKQPPKVPKAAPFFIPTVPGLEFQFSLPRKETEADTSRVLSVRDVQSLTHFGKALQDAESYDQFAVALDILKELGPSGVDIEIRSLSIEGGGSEALMLQFLKMIHSVLCKNKEFEAAQAYLGLFLKVHGDTIATCSDLKDYLPVIQEVATESWQSVQERLNTSLCLVSFLKSSAVYF